MATRNRSAGHKYECDVVNCLRTIGFPYVVSSRSENRNRDGDKVDICNRNEFDNGRLKYDIQCKTTSGTLAYITVLKQIVSDCGRIPVVLHRTTRKSASGKFMVKGEYAFLHQRDFLQLISELEFLKQRLDTLVKHET